MTRHRPNTPASKNFATPPHVKLGQKPVVKKKDEDLSKWLDRKQACALLNVALTTLLDFEKRGKLTPSRDLRIDALGREVSLWVYDPKQLAEIGVRDRRQLRNPGEMAAQAYEMFDAGKTQRDVVIALREMPSQVEELHRSWTDGGGADRVITTAAWDRIAELVGPFSTVTQLVERIERLVTMPAPASTSASGTNDSDSKRGSDGK